MLGLGLSRTKSSLVPALPAFTNADPQNDRGFVFDGSGDFLQVDDHDDFSFNNAGAGNNPFSIAFWIKRDGTGANEALFSKAATNNYEYRVFFLNDDIYFDVYDTTTSKYTRKYKGGVGNTTNWQHWVFVYDGGLTGPILTIYVNGSDIGSLSSGSSGGGGDMENLGAAFKLGAMDSSSYDYDGKMMQVILWDTELTADEAAYIYASGNAARNPLVESATYSKHNNVIAWWPLDDANGHEDHGGRGHDFTKNGNADLDTGADAPW